MDIICSGNKKKLLKLYNLRITQHKKLLLYRNYNSHFTDLVMNSPLLHNQ
jgi:hypothetical protein